MLEGRWGEQLLWWGRLGRRSFWSLWRSEMDASGSYLQVAGIPARIGRQNRVVLGARGGRSGPTSGPPS